MLALQALVDEGVEDIGLLYVVSEETDHSGMIKANELGEAGLLFLLLFFLAFLSSSSKKYCPWSRKGVHLTCRRNEDVVCMQGRCVPHHQERLFSLRSINNFVHWLARTGQVHIFFVSSRRG